MTVAVIIYCPNIRKSVTYARVWAKIFQKKFIKKSWRNACILTKKVYIKQSIGTGGGGLPVVSLFEQ